MARVFVYDKTQGWLTSSWWFGSLLRSMRPGKDIVLKVSSWDDMIAQLAALPAGSVSRVEFWGHGISGGVKCGTEWAWGPTMQSKDPVRRIAEVLAKVRHILAPDAVWWWRACNTFRGEAGRAFAKMCVTALGCRVAAFTRIIWWWQADLRIATPGADPDWDDSGGGYSWPWHDSVWCMSKGPFDA